MEKKTKDLAPEEILAFEKHELEHWMNRVMSRLFLLVEREVYNKLSRDFVLVCRGGIDYAKRGLIQLVKVIQEKWPETSLHVIR